MVESTEAQVIVAIVGLVGALIGAILGLCGTYLSTRQQLKKDREQREEQFKSLQIDRLRRTYINCINELSKIEQQERLFIDEREKNYSQVMHLLNNLLIIHSDKGSLEYRDLYDRIMNLSKRGFFEGDARDLKADLIKMASGQDPAVYWFNKGMDLYDKGIENLDRDEFEKCIRYFKKAIEKDQKYTKAWHYKGLAFRKYGDSIRKDRRNEANELWKEAIGAFEIAENLEPENSAIYLKDKSYTLNRLRRYDECIKVCDEIIKEAEEDSISLVARKNKAYALFGKARSRNDFLAAAEAYDEVLKIKEDFDALFCKGNALFAAGEYERAIKDFIKVTAINPNYIEAWNKEGEALKALGRIEEADAAFAKAKIGGTK